jgi:hypothetical protein
MKRLKITKLFPSASKKFINSFKVSVDKNPLGWLVCDPQVGTEYFSSKELANEAVVKLKEWGNFPFVLHKSEIDWE